MDRVFIYTLHCPTTGKVRYVGKTQNPTARLKEHLKLRSRESSHRVHWLRSLAAKGLCPIMTIVDSVFAMNWPSWEAAYIDFFTSSGYDLVNSNGGGQGGMSPETAAKRSGVNHHFFGKKFSPEHRDRLSAAKKGKYTGQNNPFFGKQHSQETLARIIASQTGEKSVWWGKKLPSETVEKMRQAKQGAVFSSEHREKLRLAHLGHRPSLETRAKMSASQKARQSLTRSKNGTV